MLGFARVEKLRVLEGDINIPYQALGILEVQEKASIFRPSDIFYRPLKLLTLGFKKTPSRAQKLKEKLDHQLQVKARDHYGADAVIHVKYWPALDSEAFPGGVVYAQGQMVSYEHFPQKEATQKIEKPAFGLSMNLPLIDSEGKGSSAS